MADRKTIGERLRKLRGKRTLKDVAKACNISPSALSMYEQGARIPRDEIKMVLAKYYNRAIQKIFFAS